MRMAPKLEILPDRAIARRHDAAGDDGVFADLEQIGGDGDGDGRDHRAGADLRAEAAQEQVEQRLAGEQEGRGDGDEPAGDPEAEIIDAPELDRRRPGAADQQPFGGDGERVEAEEPRGDDDLGAADERPGRAHGGVGEAEARLQRVDADQAGDDIERQLAPRRSTYRRGGSGPRRARLRRSRPSAWRCSARRRGGAPWCACRCRAWRPASAAPSGGCGRKSAPSAANGRRIP